MRAGARGYVPAAELESWPCGGRRATWGGDACPIITSKVLDYFRAGPDCNPAMLDEVSVRELEVLQVAADGLTNKQIAEQLFITEKTVKNHISNTFAKLNVNDRTQAILYALRQGLVSVAPADGL